MPASFFFSWGARYRTLGTAAVLAAVADGVSSAAPPERALCSFGRNASNMAARTSRADEAPSPPRRSVAASGAGGGPQSKDEGACAAPADALRTPTRRGVSGAGDAIPAVLPPPLAPR